MSESGRGSAGRKRWRDVRRSNRGSGVSRFHRESLDTPPGSPLGESQDSRYRGEPSAPRAWLDAEVGGDAGRGVRAVDSAAVDDLAELKYRVAVGHRQGELDVLLDQQDRHVGGRALGP